MSNCTPAASTLIESMMCYKKICNYYIEVVGLLLLPYLMKRDTDITHVLLTSDGIIDNVTQLADSSAWKRLNSSLCSPVKNDNQLRRPPN